MQPLGMLSLSAVLSGVPESTALAAGMHDSVAPKSGENIEQRCSSQSCGALSDEVPAIMMSSALLSQTATNATLIDEKSKANVILEATGPHGSSTFNYHNNLFCSLPMNLQNDDFGNFGSQWQKEFQISGEPPGVEGPMH